MAGEWNWTIFKVLSNPGHPMVLWFYGNAANNTSTVLKTRVCVKHNIWSATMLHPCITSPSQLTHLKALTATTTGTPNIRAFWICLFRLLHPLATSWRFCREDSMQEAYFIRGRETSVPNPLNPEANGKNVKMGMKPQRQISIAAFGTVQTTANSWTTSNDLWFQLPNQGKRKLFLLLFVMLKKLIPVFINSPQ